MKIKGSKAFFVPHCNEFKAEHFQQLIERFNQVNMDKKYKQAVDKLQLELDELAKQLQDKALIIGHLESILIKQQQQRTQLQKKHDNIHELLDTLRHYEH